MARDNDHLNHLPTLKAYTINGPVRFHATPVVWFKIQFTLDNVETLQDEFYEFLKREKIYGPWQVRAGTSGGGAYSGAFTEDEAVKIKAWLAEKGAVETDEA